MLGVRGSLIVVLCVMAGGRGVLFVVRRLMRMGWLMLYGCGVLG